MVCILTERELRSMEQLAQRMESRGMAVESETLRNIIRVSSKRREVKASVAAAVFDVSSQTIRNWVKAGMLAGRIDDTGHVLVSVDALRSVIEMDAAMAYQPSAARDFSLDEVQEIVDAVRAERRTKKLA